MKKVHSSSSPAQSDHRRSLVKTSPPSAAMVRPRLDLEPHKDLIIKLYEDHTPWNKIAQALLDAYGIKAPIKTIMRRMKEWNVGFHRVESEINDELKAKIKEYWADRQTRPKSDDEFCERLKQDGFTLTKGAIAALRRDLRLFRRWDERLGRIRPDSELGKRKRRKQKWSAFTEAQLAPPPNAEESSDDDDDDVGHFEDNGSDDPEPANAQQTQMPPGMGRNAQVQGSSNASKRQPRQRRQPPPAQTSQQPAQPIQTSAQGNSSGTVVVGIVDRDALIEELQDRIHILEQHCLAHGIGLPYPSPGPDVPGLQSLAAAVDMTWQGDHGFRF